jgi:YHS domain-containing protein
MNPSLYAPIRMALVFVFALFSASPARAQTNTNGGTDAIGGFDPVAYFTDHAAVHGMSEHVFSWRGARWLFASEAHRAAFAANPARYAPAYDGYCAFAAAQGRRVRVDPHAFFVENGRLFLNYSQAIRTQWLADRARFIREADAHFPPARFD